MYEETKRHLDSCFESEPLSLTERRAQYEKKVLRAVSTLAGNIIRLKNKDTFELASYGELVKIIHQRWELSHPSHAESGSEDFVEKYNWVQQINNQLETVEDIPLWLNR